MKNIRIWPLPFLFLLGPATPGCQPDPDDRNSGATDPTLSAISDSAGIRIVENARPAEGSRLWRVTPGPALSIGDREGNDAYLLYQVSDATRLPDGRIVVASSGDNEMRVFDASGTHVATWGGAGEGPGEFQYLELVEPWPGDSIIAWYGPRNGVLVFDSEGNLGRAFTLEPTVEHPIASVRAMAVIPDGTILAGHHPHVLDPVVVEIRDAEGRLRSSLGEHPGDERHITPDGYRADPIFSSVFVDRLDHLWVEEFELPGQARPGSLWTVFDPGGRVLGFVETPDRLEIFEIGEDYILGRSWDEMYVEYVQLWALER